MGRTAMNMNKKLVAVLCMAALAALAGCGDKKAQAEKPGAEAAEKKESGLKLSAEEIQRAGVQVTPLQAQTADDVVKVTATIKANQDRAARIAPRVEGRIVRVAANLGDRVRAGQTLAVLDSVSLGEAQSAMREAQAAHRVAQADYDRASKLATEEIVPQKDVLRARGELDKASAQVRAARDKLRLLGATGGADETGFAIVSPIAGTVIEKKASMGELATPEQPLFAVADLSRVWIEANLTEDVLARIKTGAAATVTVAAYPGEQFAGKVTYVAGVLDKESRTIPARIEVANPDGRLKPEMFATAEISTGATRANVLAVPDAAVVIMQGQPSVFVEGANGNFEQRAIEPGEKNGGRTVIRSGVKPGEKVVTAGAYALKARVLKSQISDEH